MKRKGLTDKIMLAGSGQSNADDWHINAVDHFHGIFGGYTFHRYEWNEFIRNQKFISYVRNLIDYVKEKDPEWKSKQVIISEAGMRDGQSTAINTIHLCRSLQKLVFLKNQEFDRNFIEKKF